jgi:hypothetical protein
MEKRMYNNGMSSDVYRNAISNDASRASIAPKFIVGHLSDVHICTNWKMAEDLADFGLSVELGPNEKHLYAFFKQLKRNALYVRRKLEENRQQSDSLQGENTNYDDYEDDR